MAGEALRNGATWSLRLDVALSQCPRSGQVAFIGKATHRGQNLGPWVRIMIGKLERVSRTYHNSLIVSDRLCASWFVYSREDGCVLPPIQDQQSRAIKQVGACKPPALDGIRQRSYQADKALCGFVISMPRERGMNCSCICAHLLFPATPVLARFDPSTLEYVFVRSPYPIDMTKWFPNLKLPLDSLPALLSFPSALPLALSSRLHLRRTITTPPPKPLYSSFTKCSSCLFFLSCPFSLFLL